MGQTAITMASAIQSLCVVGDDGRIDFGAVDMYADALGIGLDEAECLIDDALEIMESEGTVFERDNHYYMREEYEEWKANGIAWEQERIDEIQAYSMFCEGEL